MAATCTEPLFFRLTLRMGAKDSRVVEGRRLCWFGKKGKKEIPIAAGDVEPLFKWVPKPAIDWLTPREELIREVPIPREADEAGELAFAMGRDFGAIAVHGDAELHPESYKTLHVTYYAITSFDFLSTESAESRAKGCKQMVGRLLRDLSTTLIEDFPRYGSAGARQYAYKVSDLGALVAATAKYYAHGTAMQAPLDELTEKLVAWSLRAAIPTDEGLRVGAEIGAEANNWKAR